MSSAPVGSPTMAAAALRQHYNKATAEYFAASVCGIIALFAVLHWTRQVGGRSAAEPGVVKKPFTAASRLVRRILVRAAPGFNSAGHGFLVAVYVAVNLALLLTNVDTTILGPVASRLGWLLVSNMCFVVFLALKNTPLAYLTAYSYERLNGLHQIAGGATFALMVVHAAAYTRVFYQRGRMDVLHEDAQVAGIVAGCMFAVIVASALLLRRYAYEAFYVLHVAAFVVAVVCVGLHRPDMTTRVPVVTCLTAALFAADRVLRLGRLLANGTNNEATLHPLPDGGTRILLAKAPPRSAAGKHVFVWIPRLRLLEAHPFTIVGVGAGTRTKKTELELVVKACSGFTRRLHAHAAAHAGVRLAAACDGPYGTSPDAVAYDRVVLIAGGSGASYTVGVAAGMLARMAPTDDRRLVFVWTAKTAGTLAWYSAHLHALQARAPQVDVQLFVTGGVDRAGINEKADEAGTSGTEPLPYYSPGRPDTATVIRDAVSSATSSQRVLVAACGPPSLMTTVRNAAAACITVDGPSVEVHCEQFGW